MAMTRTKATFAPPVMQALSWLDGLDFSATYPLINVSQAAPVDPPPHALRAEMARLVQDEPDIHLYGPVLGLGVAFCCEHIVPSSPLRWIEKWLI